MSRATRTRLARLARGRAGDGVRLLEGPKSVLDALRAGHVEAVWRGESLPESLGQALDEAAAAEDLPMGLGTDVDFERISTTKQPQGAVAVVRDPARSLGDVLAHPGWLLWLDGMQDPGNVGTLVRTGAALGAAGLLIGQGSAHPMGAKALRASAGCALHLPFAVAPSTEIAQALAADGRAVWLLEAGGQDVRELETPPASGVLIVGAEGAGPSDAARDAACLAVEIPMSEGVESLNASVAGAIALSQIRWRCEGAVREGSA